MSKGQRGEQKTCNCQGKLTGQSERAGMGSYRGGGLRWEEFKQCLTEEEGVSQKVKWDLEREEVTVKKRR